VILAAFKSAYRDSYPRTELMDSLFGRPRQPVSMSQTAGAPGKAGRYRANRAKFQGPKGIVETSSNCVKTRTRCGRVAADCWEMRA
jgi:hypothetical protein